LEKGTGRTAKRGEGARRRKMMKCPYCENKKTRVIDSRAVDEGGSIRRRRLCEACGGRFTTFERRERVEVAVLKGDGHLEAYDRSKLSAGIYMACNKRDISEEVIESVIDSIEEEIMRAQSKEIDSSAVGRMVMERLRGIDEVAYMRFASVCKKFDDASEFQKEYGELKQFDRSA